MKRRRRQNNHIQYQIIYWRDIPVQLRVQQGRNRLSHQLPEVFQKTVYRAAYRAKAITGDAYEASWRAEGWFSFEGSDGNGELEEAASTIAVDVASQYDEARLDALALNKGYEPSAGSDG